MSGTTRVPNSLNLQVTHAYPDHVGKQDMCRSVSSTSNKICLYLSHQQLKVVMAIPSGTEKLFSARLYSK